ncbi:DUF1801 domain-containing protein [Actinophytocola gossypii]|uniref:DUF1801 domain-containing protein n=1 Tax=Actinophytocola gossypii TaxID=2812003 RepID=A0ABT2J631_9PSEU|nr:DUF1801 domain-containing protein [Actinophytocola gossypii]MCT2583317.1 DUF1801 domain-containing protein [Actinophytocola gossypii]
MKPDQAEADALADLVRTTGEDLDEAIKWRRLTFTAGGDWHHWVCAVAVTTRGVNLMFHKGALLDDPARLLRGEGRYLRQIPSAAALEHPNEVHALVRAAVARQTDMLD